MEFKVGDKVRLKNGEWPNVMTIEHIEVTYPENQPTGYLICSHDRFRIKVTAGRIIKIQDDMPSH